MSKSSQAKKADSSYLHSVLELNPDALSIAAALDAERAAGKYRGPSESQSCMLLEELA